MELVGTEETRFFVIKNQSKAHEMKRRNGRRWKTYCNLWQISCGDRRRWGLEYELDIACRNGGKTIRVSIGRENIGSGDWNMDRNILFSLFPFEDGRFQRTQWCHVHLLAHEPYFRGFVIWCLAWGRVWLRNVSSARLGYKLTIQDSTIKIVLD